MPCNRKSGQFHVAVVLVMTIIILSLGNYLRWWNLHFDVGPLYFHHWLSFIGAGYIAIFAPICAIMKRRSPERLGTLLNIQVFGNLVAFLLISLHFTHQMGRPEQFAPTLGTGLALYIIVATMVVTGFMQRFQLAGRFLKSLEIYPCWLEPVLLRLCGHSYTTRHWNYIVGLIHRSVEFGGCDMIANTSSRNNQNKVLASR